MSEIRITATPAQTLALIEGLATNDAFRARFESDPAVVLEEHGVFLSPEEMPAEVHLPPKHELDPLVQELRGSIEAAEPFTRFIIFHVFAFSFRPIPFRRFSTSQ